MTPPPHVLILGAGLAGTCAACEARRLGARVTLVSGAPGAVAAWSGALDVFGPWVAPRGAGLPLLSPDRAKASGWAPASGDAATRGARLARLSLLRPDHPYARLGLDADAIAAHVQRALEVLSDGAQNSGLRLLGDLRIANDVGLATRADGASAPLAGHLEALTRAKTLVWLDLPGTDRTPPEMACALLADQLGWAPERVTPWALDADALPAPWTGEVLAPERWRRVLADGPEGAPGVLDAIDHAMPEHLRSADVCALTPPVWGMTQATALAWGAALRARLGCAVVERAETTRPIHGLRLWRWLEGCATQASATTLRGKVERVELERDGGPDAPVTGAVLHMARRAPERVEALTGVILATGRFISGGVRMTPPLREALLDLPLTLSGQRLDNPDVAPVHLLAEQPWQDHPLWTAGVAVDADLKPLIDRGHPFAPNVFAAGRVIGGTHPDLDGTAQGVDLITGLRAARSALGA